MQWKKFKSSSDLDYNFFIYGNNGKYDSNGYYQNFTAYLTSLSQFRSYLTEMKSQNYIDVPTLAIIVSFAIYNPQLDSFVSVVQLYERSSSQYMFGSRSIILPFKLSGFKRNDQGIMSIDVVRIILLCYILYLLVSTMVSSIKSLTFDCSVQREIQKMHLRSKVHCIRVNTSLSFSSKCYRLQCLSVKNRSLQFSLRIFCKKKC